MYNEYEQYAALAEDTKMFAGNKINVDIDTLDKLSEYNEVDEFISKNYGNIPESGICFECPNDINLAILKSEKTIEIIAIQGDYIIFSKGWRLVKKDETTEENK